MANKAFKGGTSTNMRTPTNTADKGNKPKVNDNSSIATPNKEGTFAKKMPMQGRAQGTWGGKHNRP